MTYTPARLPSPSTDRLPAYGVDLSPTELLELVEGTEAAVNALSRIPNGDDDPHAALRWMVTNALLMCVRTRLSDMVVVDRKTDPLSFRTAVYGVEDGLREHYKAAYREGAFGANAKHMAVLEALPPAVDRVLAAFNHMATQGFEIPAQRDPTR